MSAFQKLEAFLHLATYFICPLTVIGFVVALLYYAIFPPSFWLIDFWRYQVAWLTLALSLIIYSAPFIASAIVVTEFSHSGISKLRRLAHLGYLGALVYTLLLSNTKGVIDGLFLRKSYFQRTPKLGIQPNVNPLR